MTEDRAPAGATGTPSAAESVLRLVRRFAAPRERVFDAWTDPDALVRWFHPGVEALRAELDPQAGGAYRFEMRRPDTGERFHVTGRIRELRRPEYLELSWRPGVGRPGDELCETVVAVSFADRGLECELRLEQQAFPTAAARDLHRHGWERCLELLRTFLERSGG